MVKKRKIIVDTDPGIDDAVALAIALFDEFTSVELVTTVAGNVGLDKVTNNALKLMTFWGKNVHVSKGARQPLLAEQVDASDVHGETGMDGYDFPEVNSELLVEDNAVLAMHKLLNNSDEKITIVAIGPLTNIALLLQTYPEDKDYIDEIIMMGGALGRGNKGVLSEFNIAVDPDAAYIVFNSKLPLVLAPLDVGLKALVYPEDSEKIKTMNRTGDMICQLFKKYRGGSYKTGLKMYDSCAIAYLLMPELFEVVDCFVGIERFGDYTSGATVIDLKGYLNKEANCKVCIDIDDKEFKKWFLEAINKCI